MKMDVRKLLVLLAVGLGLMLPVAAQAATYRLPVRTATLAVSLDHYGEFANGVPVGAYEFCIDPPVLRVGWDAATNRMYNSYIMFNLQDYSQVPADATIYYSLYLATAWAPEGVEDFGASLMPWADTPVPEVSDFDWSEQVGQTMWSPILFSNNQTLHDTYGPSSVPSVSGPVYLGWLLIESPSGDFFGQSPIEIAGINNPYGMEGPHILVTTVPEPCSLICLGTACLSLGGLLSAAGKRRGRLSIIRPVSLLLLLAAAAIADDDMELNSEPGMPAETIQTVQ
jgi:hypothetical protein